MDINSNTQKTQKFLSLIREDIIDNQFEYLISDNQNKFRQEDKRRSSIFLEEILKTPNKSPLLVHKEIDYSRGNSPLIKKTNTIISIAIPKNVLKEKNFISEKTFKQQKDKNISRKQHIHKKKKKMVKLKQKKQILKQEIKNNKKSKGLKSLSILVKNLVESNESLSYNEVTNLIIESTIDKEFISQIKKPVNEKQNIKRRVYDALNVLIAAGILKKEGKNVKKNLEENKIKINTNRMNIEKLKLKMKKKLSLIKSKKSDLRKKKKNLYYLKNLIEKNKKFKDSKLVNFPFLVVQPTLKQFTCLNMTMQSNMKKLCISSNNQINFYGDLEIISILKDNK